MNHNGNGKGCILMIGVGISFWSWFIMGFMDVRSYIGACIGAAIIMLSFMTKRKYKKQITEKYILNTCAMSYALAVLINLIIGVSMTYAIIATFAMLLGFMSIFFGID